MPMDAIVKIVDVMAKIMLRLENERVNLTEFGDGHYFDPVGARRIVVTYQRGLRDRGPR